MYHHVSTQLSSYILVLSLVWWSWVQKTCKPICNTHWCLSRRMGEKTICARFFGGPYLCLGQNNWRLQPIGVLAMTWPLAEKGWSSQSFKVIASTHTLLVSTKNTRSVHKTQRAKDWNLQIWGIFFFEGEYFFRMFLVYLLFVFLPVVVFWFEKN